MIQYANLYFTSTTLWSCGLIYHVLHREVGGSNLAIVIKICYIRFLHVLLILSFFLWFVTAFRLPVPWFMGTNPFTPYSGFTLGSQVLPIGT